MNKEQGISRTLIRTSIDRIKSKRAITVKGNIGCQNRITLLSSEEIRTSIDRKHAVFNYLGYNTDYYLHSLLLNFSRTEIQKKDIAFMKTMQYIEKESSQYIL